MATPGASVDLDAAAFSSWKEASERCRREVLVSFHFHDFSYTLLIYVNLLHLVTLLNCATPQKLPSVAVACSVGA